MPPAFAARVDPYVSRYLKVTQPVDLPADAQGNHAILHCPRPECGQAIV
jgi:hypothetical protein